MSLTIPHSRKRWRRPRRLSVAITTPFATWPSEDPPPVFRTGSSPYSVTLASFPRPYIMRRLKRSSVMRLQKRYFAGFDSDECGQENDRVKRKRRHPEVSGGACGALCWNGFCGPEPCPLPRTHSQTDSRTDHCRRPEARLSA